MKKKSKPKTTTKHDVFVERQTKRLEKMLTRQGFTCSPDSPQRPDMNCYHRRRPYHGAHAMFHVYMNRKDGEIQLISESDRGSEILCTTYDVAEVENLLTRSENRLRFPRT